MITSKQCLARYGDPTIPANEAKYMTMYLPAFIPINTVPRRIYCNKELIAPLRKALWFVSERKLIDEIKTWDGCFNVRKKRGAASMSLHSWGLAIDLNAAWNGFGKAPTMHTGLVKCFTDAGFDWGGTWSTPDGMHFQLKEFPK